MNLKISEGVGRQLEPVHRPVGAFQSQTGRCLQPGADWGLRRRALVSALGLGTVVSILY